MKTFTFCLLFILAASLASAQRITVKGNQFQVNGKRIWISGANTPWKDWNEFGNKFDAAWWRAHFRELRASHVNATRVWISCNGDNPSPGIDANGNVSAPIPAFWRDLDTLFKIAQENRVYLMLALISFDHSKPGNHNAEAWKRMYSRPAGRKSFVDNYTVPLVERYKSNPWFFSIDVGNELVWAWENHGVARKDTLDLVARVANAVHARSKVLVCEGEGAGPKYNSSKYEGNFYSDKSLGALQPGAHVDFYNIHYYDWVRQWFGSPFERSPADYGIDDKPCIIGECPAKGSGGQAIADNYRNAFAKGWQGIMPWTSNGVDDNGSLSDMRPGLQWLVKAHADLIVPARSGRNAAVGFILGADISWAQEQEEEGVRFTDRGKQQDLLAILKSHGFNWIRLRVFHDPKAAKGYSKKGYCDLDHTLVIAKRIKAAGMGFLLDFHYSDTWADPSHQFKPAAWANLHGVELEKAVHDHTRDVILALKKQGTPPDIVQIGNEISNGFLWPDGQVWKSGQWDVFCGLIRAGIAGAKETDPSVKIMLHLAWGGQNAQSRSFLDKALAQGVEFDLIGQSYYPKWHGTLDDLQANLTDLAARYKQDIIVAEYSVPNIRQINEIAHGLPDGKGLGTFIWEPTKWEGPALFDAKGNAKPEIDLYSDLAEKFGALRKH